MQIKLRGNKVAIERLKSAKSTTDLDFIKVPDSEEYTGVVRYVGESASKDLQVGQKVYFSTQHQQVRMAGQVLCVLEDINVYAIVED
jgi:co-chaperonin GroES (HSP10)